MPRYFFHVRLGERILLDEVGCYVIEGHEIKRLIMEAAFESGLNLSSEWVFEIADTSGDIILRVPVAELPTKQ